jgi:predicted nucleic acid-binding protein
VIDSWAWIEYLKGSSAGKKVRKKLVNDRNEVFTHVVSIAEIISKIKRRNSDVEDAWSATTSLSKIVEANEIEYSMQE